MAPEAWTLVSPDATSEILLIHTVICGMGIGVSVILLRALLSLRRSGEALPGLGIMIWTMLITELLRAGWLGFQWFSRPAPPLLDVLAFITGFIVLAGVPVIVSAKYLPKEGASSVAPQPWVWLQRAMVLTAVIGFAVLLGAIRLRLRTAVFLGPAAAYILTAIFLLSRIFFYRHLQVRRRPLLLFVIFMVSGLSVLAGVGLFTIVSGVRIRQSLSLTSLNGAGLVLVLCGIVFLFANVRLADVIVKRAMHTVAWTCASLLTWLAIMQIGGLSLGVHRTAQELLCLLLVCTVLLLAPQAKRGLDRWVDQWVFDQPDLQAAVSALWGKLLEIENQDQEQAFLLTENYLQHILELSAVRVVPLNNFTSVDLIHTRPGAHFISQSSAIAHVLSPPANIVIPLFVDGSAEHLIALSQGVVRPPLTAWEIGFLERIAGRLQIWLGMRAASDRARHEASLQEELASAELRALRAQVNPHFLFNSLNTIADLAVIAPSQAEEMTVRLSSVFRYVLVNTDRHFTPLEKEIEFARSYLQIEQTRFGERLTVEFDIDSATLDEEVPTLLLQPLIENALKHGIAPRREGGTLTICSRKTGESIFLSVTDDGVGLQHRVAPSERSTRVGVENVINRLKTAYGGRASFTLRRREQGGTEALIVIRKGQSV